MKLQVLVDSNSFRCVNALAENSILRTLQKTTLYLGFNIQNPAIQLRSVLWDILG